MSKELCPKCQSSGKCLYKAAFMKIVEAIAPAYKDPKVLRDARLLFDAIYLTATKQKCEQAKETARLISDNH